MASTMRAAHLIVRHAAHLYGPAVSEHLPWRLRDSRDVEDVSLPGRAVLVARLASVWAQPDLFEAAAA